MHFSSELTTIERNKKFQLKYTSQLWPVLKLKIKTKALFLSAYTYHFPINYSNKFNGALRSPTFAAIDKFRVRLLVFVIFSSIFPRRKRVKRRCMHHISLFLSFLLVQPFFVPFDYCMQMKLRAGEQKLKNHANSIKHMKIGRCSTLDV